MARVIWTPEALGNLETIGDYLLDVAPQVASTLLAAIVGAVDPLADFPRMGRVVPEFGLDGLRELIVESYRIVYSIDGDTVWVVSVLHGTMDVAARLRQYGER